MFDHFLRSLASCSAAWCLLRLLGRLRGSPRADEGTAGFSQPSARICNQPARSECASTSPDSPHSSFLGTICKEIKHLQRKRAQCGTAGPEGREGALDKANGPQPPKIHQLNGSRSLGGTGNKKGQ